MAFIFITQFVKEKLWNYIHTDGTIKTIVKGKKDNPNTSFPSIISQEILNELGYSPILLIQLNH